MADMLESKKLVIFDLDGTLVQTHAQELEFFFNQLKTATSIPLSSDISAYENRSFASVINTFPISQRDELFSEMSHHVEQFVKNLDWTAIPQGSNFYDTVLKQNIDFYIVTGNFYPPSIIKAEKAGYEIPRERLIATSLSMESKLTIIEKLISDSGCNKNEVLSFGDTQYDFEIAKELGIDFILIN